MVIVALHALLWWVFTRFVDARVEAWLHAGAGALKPHRGETDARQPQPSRRLGTLAVQVESDTTLSP